MTRRIDDARSFDTVPDQRTPELDIRAFDPRMGGIPLSERAQIGSLPRVMAIPPQPQSDASYPAVLHGDPAAQVLTYQHPFAKALTAILRVSPPLETSFVDAGGNSIGGQSDATNPYNVVTVSGGVSLPGNIPQAIECVGVITFGHQGLAYELPFNMPLGALLRVQAMASSIAVKAKLSPRYFKKLGGPTIFSWLVGPLGSNFARNVAFDGVPNLSSGVLLSSVQPVQVAGFTGDGFTAPVPPSRIFFGWVDNAVAQNTQHLCPVPRGAQTMILISDATATNNDPGAGGAFQGCTLQFNQICQSPGAGTTRRYLNFPANVTVPLRADCVAIEVVNVTVPVTAVPFELQYDVGF